MERVEVEDPCRPAPGEGGGGGGHPVPERGSAPDRALPRAEGLPDEVDLIEGALRLDPRSRVLAVPCGDARHAIELARRGHRVLAVDAPGRIPAAEAPGLELRAHDLSHLPWFEDFDGALCPPGGFLAADADEAARFLREVRRTLRAGARLLLAAEVAESRDDPLCWLEVRREGSGPLPGLCHLLRLATEAGFRVVATWSSLDRTPFAPGAERLWVVGVATGW